MVTSDLGGTTDDRSFIQENSLPFQGTKRTGNVGLLAVHMVTGLSRVLMHPVIFVIMAAMSVAIRRTPPTRGPNAKWSTLTVSACKARIFPAKIRARRRPDLRPKKWYLPQSTARAVCLPSTTIYAFTLLAGENPRKARW